MSAYTREQFEQYKGPDKFLTVEYEYPVGNWEPIDHETYEDYINTFNSWAYLYGRTE